MIYDNMEFHNTAELVPVGNTGGLRIQRFPEALRTNPEINNRGRYSMNQAAGVEIRFAAESYRTHLYLRTDSTDFPYLVFRGDYFVKAINPIPGIVQMIPLQFEEISHFSDAEKTILPKSRFSTDIWRIFLGRTEVYYHGIDAMGMEIHPPRDDEKPGQKLLVYGSSITMGAGSSNFYNAYAIQTGRIAGLDVINLGLGGACHTEGAIADWIASRTDWDYAFFELGVNMCGTFSIDAFEKRVRYFLKTIRNAHPHKHLFLTTVFPNYLSFSGPEKLDPVYTSSKQNETGYNRVLTEISAEDNSGYMHLFRGEAILTDPTLLASDVIHPSDTGHFEMAYNLAAAIKPVIC